MLHAYRADIRIAVCENMIRIYTKTGDGGETSLYGGERVKKNHHRLEAYGSVDELNSVLGLIISKSNSKGKKYKTKAKIITQLTRIQKDLLIIGSLLAGYKLLNSEKLVKKTINLENWIDELERELPALKHFILPGGSERGSLLHFIRSVCRRAERRVVELLSKEEIDINIIIYLNRLSDYFFVLARFFNYQENVPETIWQIDK